MERYEVPIDDYLAPLVEAAERGDEVVIVRDGRAVARFERSTATSDEACVRELGTLLRALPEKHVRDAAQLVREMRDEERF